MASSRTLVYLVDDDEMYIKTAVHTLSQNRSFDIKAFSSGEALLSELKKGKKKPDVVVLDYFLNAENSSAISGLEVLKQMKDYSSTEVIMLSGQENIDVAVNSVKYGSYDYVVKNKSAFIRVQNDIKRIAKTKNKDDENQKLRNFIMWLIIGLVVVMGVALLFLFDSTFFGLFPTQADKLKKEKAKQEQLELQKNGSAPIEEVSGEH